jgi:hypothetical protein
VICEPNPLGICHMVNHMQTLIAIFEICSEFLALVIHALPVELAKKKDLENMRQKISRKNAVFLTKKWSKKN